MCVNTIYGTLLATLVVIASGCGSNSTSEQAKSTTSAPTVQNASFFRAGDLVGIWLGTAKLDRVALDRHLATISDTNQRMRLQSMATTFQSISIGMEFREDATMEIDMEILPPDSPPLRENTLGKWKIETINGDRITITCSEDVGNGNFETQTLSYQISTDRNQLITVPPVGVELLPFQPRFEFERRVESKLAEGQLENAPVMR